MKKKMLILLLGVSFLTVNCAKDMACKFDVSAADANVYKCFEKTNVDFIGQSTLAQRCTDAGGVEIDTGVCPTGEIGQCTTESLLPVSGVTVKGYGMTSIEWGVFALTCLVL